MLACIRAKHVNAHFTVIWLTVGMSRRQRLHVNCRCKCKFQQCGVPAKVGSDEGGVAEHGGCAQEGAQAQRGGQGRARAVVGWRRRQAWEGGSCGSSCCPRWLQGRVGMVREGPSLQVVTERVARCQGPREGQAWWVSLHASLLALPPLGPTVLEPHLQGGGGHTCWSGCVVIQLKPGNSHWTIHLCSI